MSATAAEFESMLREAIDKAKEAAPRAIDDLVRCASSAAAAVKAVTGGNAGLELEPVDQPDPSLPVYQLLLRKVGSEAPPSDLGIYCLSEAGYPILRWYSRSRWESKRDPDHTFINLQSLEGNFKWLLSRPDSTLVILILFFQQQAREEAQPMVPPGKKRNS